MSPLFRKGSRLIREFSGEKEGVWCVENKLTKARVLIYCLHDFSHFSQRVELGKNLNFWVKKFSPLAGMMALGKASSSFFTEAIAYNLSLSSSRTECCDIDR